MLPIYNIQFCGILELMHAACIMHGKSNPEPPSRHILKAHFSIFNVKGVYIQKHGNAVLVAYNSLACPAPSKKGVASNT